MLTRTFKLVVGIGLLLIVDVIWVLSSELTKHLYEDEQFNKPYFCTYFKTSMFTIYLFLLGLIAPWREACERQNNYMLVDPDGDEESTYGQLSSPSTSALSDSTFVPIKSDTISGTESDDSGVVRSVRFSKLAEVKEMSAQEANDALVSRLSYSATLRMRQQKNHHKTARTALMFSILWFIANYLFQLALEPSEAAMVTLLSSVSSFFTLILAAVFPSGSGDKLTLSKLMSVVLCFSGVIIVTYSDIENPKFSKGAVLALLSAFFYASYLVLVKRKSDTEEKIDIPLFFGFVGLWNFLLMWPLFFVLDLTKIEVFAWPNRSQFIVLFLNGIFGTVISEALWLWGCFWTSSLIGTIAMSLQIPLSMILDKVIRNKYYPATFYLGSIPMFVSLICIAFLIKNDDSDPLLRYSEIIVRRIFKCRCRRTSIVRITELDEQHESLINNHQN